MQAQVTGSIFPSGQTTAHGWVGFEIGSSQWQVSVFIFPPDATQACMASSVGVQTGRTSVVCGACERKRGPSNTAMTMAKTEARAHFETLAMFTSPSDRSATKNSRNDT
jgi:hypothetical protein